MNFDSVAGNISSIYSSRLFQSNQRMFVPVRPMHTVYAQYRHISGRPAVGGQKTVSLSRIQLLNSLINNLQRIQRDPSGFRVSEEHSDALIQKYAAELHQAMKSIPESFGTLGGAAHAGMVFSISS